MITALLSIFCLVTAAAATPAEKLASFELTDQEQKARSYRFPKARVTVMTVVDQKGSEQLDPWIEQIKGRYGSQVDIDGIADVSMIPAPFHGMFRKAFRKERARSVLLDWGGDVVKQFGYKKGVPNVYVIDRDGRIVARASGKVSSDGVNALSSGIDRALKGGGQ